MGKRLDASCGRCYIKIVNGRTFHTEQADDGNWMLYEVIVDAAGIERREFWNDFAFKRDAWLAAVTECG